MHATEVGCNAGVERESPRGMTYRGGVASARFKTRTSTAKLAKRVEDAVCSRTLHRGRTGNFR